MNTDIFYTNRLLDIIIDTAIFAGTSYGLHMAKIVKSSNVTDYMEYLGLDFLYNYFIYRYPGVGDKEMLYDGLIRSGLLITGKIILDKAVNKNKSAMDNIISIGASEVVRGLVIKVREDMYMKQKGLKKYGPNWASDKMTQEEAYNLYLSKGNTELEKFLRDYPETRGRYLINL